MDRKKEENRNDLLGDHQENKENHNRLHQMNPRARRPEREKTPAKEEGRGKGPKSSTQPSSRQRPINSTKHTFKTPETKDA